MAKRALVAGGAGFIGSHLVDLLLKKDYEQVIILDNFVTSLKRNIDHLRDQKNVTFIEADITDEKTFDPLANENFDEIYNMASPASPKDFQTMPLFIMQTNSVGHHNLLKLAQKTKARILYASTSEAYGDPLVHPQPEDYFGNVNTIGPRACYDESKRFGETLTMTYHREYGVDTRISRIFNTYGSRMHPKDGRIIPNFFTQALAGEGLTIYGDGSQTRSYCYVTDEAEGLYQLMQSGETRPVNVGNPIERSVLDMANTINELTGNKAEHRYLPLPENDPKQRRPDTKRAEETFGWNPQTSLEDGLALSLDYFKSIQGLDA